MSSLLLTSLLLIYIGYGRPLPSLTIDGTSVAIGFNHVCVLSAMENDSPAGIPLCSGNNETKAVPPMDIPRLVQVVTGTYFSCGLAEDQSVHCWGKIDRPPLGFYSQLSAGSYYACGLLIDRSIQCWGQSRVVAAIAAASRETQQLVSLGGAATGYEQLSCGPDQCCAIDTRGKLHCWGQLGRIPVYLNDSSNSTGLSAAADLTRLSMDTFDLMQVSTGGDVSCAIAHPRQDLLCWGSLDKHGMVTRTPGPFLQIAASSGRLGLCAIRADRSVQCWGQARSLTAFTRGVAWDQMVLGASIVCGISMHSQLRCGGGNGVKLNFPSNLVVT